MLKKVIEYVDFDGNKRTEEFYFHLNAAEISSLEVDEEGLVDRLRSAVTSKDRKIVVGLFNNLIKAAVGYKSPDGKRFTKNDEITSNLMDTNAYEKLFLEILTDTNSMLEFFKGILPGELSEVFDARSKELFPPTGREMIQVELPSGDIPSQPVSEDKIHLTPKRISQMSNEEFEALTDQDFFRMSTETLNAARQRMMNRKKKG